VDWLQNVRAAGRATISSQGENYDVVQPEIIDAAAALPLLSARRRRTFERVGIEGVPQGHGPTAELNSASHVPLN
jgi:hypothetical protein